MDGSIKRPRVQATWTDVTGKPSTFPPVVSDVESVIAITAPADHTHDLAEINISGASLNDTIKWNGTNWVPTAPSGGSGTTVYTQTVAFTDGDTARRVTVSNGSVSGTSKIVCTIRRPDTADDSADRGYLYIANVVRIGSGGFDVLISALDLSGLDPTINPPNETITLTYTIG